MKLGCFGMSGLRLARILAAALACAACSDDSSDGGFGSSPWTWADLGGPPAMKSERVGNHEPLVVVDTDLLLGTGDGVWRRPLSGTEAWKRGGLEGKVVHALVATSDGKRLIAAGYDPADESAPTVWYSTDEGASWTAAAEWPRGEPGIPPAGMSFPFYSLEADPAKADVVYGGLEANTVAVTVDGGATWILTDGATEPNFGDHCVSYRPAESPVLLQGCELPLDVAWLGALDIVEDDRFQLPGFRFFYGYPDLAELGNRRINAIAPAAGRDDRVLVGVEGGLVELTSTSGEWTGRPDITARWIFRAEEDTPELPYAYIRAIVTLDSAGSHLLFGGMINGANEELSLFETTNGGSTVARVLSPAGLQDPRVEQAVRLSTKDVLLVISEDDSTDLPPEVPGRSLRVYSLQRS